MDGQRGRVGAAAQTATPIYEGPPSGGYGCESHHVAIVVGSQVGILDNRATREGHRQSVIILDVVGGNDRASLDGQGSRVGTAG